MTTKFLEIISKPIFKLLGAVIIGGGIGLGIKKLKNNYDKFIDEESLKLKSEILKNLICEITILDTNIWMLGPKHEFLFDFIFLFCEKNNRQVYFPSFQLQEFQKPKNDDDLFLKTLAKKRLEKYQRKGLIKFEHYDSKFSYVDDSLIYYIIDRSKIKNSISFITEDRELRIKALALEEIKDTLSVHDKISLYNFYKKFTELGSTENSKKT